MLIKYIDNLHATSERLGSFYTVITDGEVFKGTAQLQVYLIPFAGGIGRALRQLNKAVARSLRPIGQARRHSSLDTLVAVDEAQRAVEQSKWSSSTATVTIRPPRLPAMADFGPVVSGSPR